MHANLAHRPKPSRPQVGFTLIELMIALVIGMAAVTIMLTMLSKTDAAKRITVGGNDAQIAGTIALFHLEREIRAAGYGINAPGVLGCTLSYTVVGKPALVPLAPVTINPPGIPAGTPSTDTLLVVYGTASESADGDPLAAASANDAYQVTRVGSFRKNDIVVVQNATRSNPCTLTPSQVLRTDDATSTLVFDTSKDMPGVAGKPAGSIVYNLGELTVHVYAIRGGNLTMCDYRLSNCGDAGLKDDTSVWVPMAQNIVALRAQYGKDGSPLTSARTGVITQYDQVIPSDANRLNCDWARVVTLRIGLVARGAVYDKELGKTIQLNEPTWSGGPPADPDKPPLIPNPNPVPIDLDVDDNGKPDADWKQFRHKTLETTIPLRNTIWQGDTEC
ncbi:MAG: PilW family protein [Aquabacterium sp.]